VTAEHAKRVFYNDLSPEEGDKWAAKLQSQSAGVYTSTQSYAAWRYIPSTFVIGKQDETSITQEVVNFIIDTARANEPSAFDVVEECDAGEHLVAISLIEVY
jgi:hypothetical protein